MSNPHAALASAAVVNINHDLVRRHNLEWLEAQVVDLWLAYQTLTQAGDTEQAAAVYARGIEMKTRLRRAQQRERMGAE